MSDAAGFHWTVPGDKDASKGDKDAGKGDVIAGVVCAGVVVAALLIGLVVCCLCRKKERVARAHEPRAPASPLRRQDPEETAAVRIQETGAGAGAGAQGDSAPEAEDIHEHSGAVAVRDNVCGMCRAAYSVQGGFAPEMLECSHCFHRRCIQRWLRVNLACPTCNTTHITLLGKAPRHRYTASMGIDGSACSRDDIVVGRSSFHF